MASGVTFMVLKPAFSKTFLIVCLLDALAWREELAQKSFSSLLTAIFLLHGSFAVRRAERMEALTLLYLTALGSLPGSR